MDLEESVNGLNKISKERIEKLYLDQDKFRWNVFDERQLLENLLSQRFNYFIVVFSLFITASATVKDVESLIVVLSLGTIIQFTIWLTIYRSFRWLEIVFKIMDNFHEKSNIYSVVVDELEDYNWLKNPPVHANRMVGIYIPLFCCSVFVTTLVLVVLGYIGPFNL